MPLWSVEEWRARIGSSWAALGRTFPSCQSGHKEWRPSRRGGGEGGPMVVSTVPVTTFMLMCTTVSVTVAQPAVDDGHSPMFHNVSSYHGNKSSGSSYKSSGSWEHTSPMVTVFWKKLLSWSSVKQLAGDLLPKDLSLLRKNILSSIFTFSVLAFSLLVALQLKRATFQASLLARCGDIEPNPGPLGREDYVPKLKDLVFELKGVDYHVLGIQLEVPEPTLRNISRDHATADRRLSEVIQYWMNNNQSISWMEIITALERIGGHQNIIDKIKPDNITVTPSQMGQAVENKVLGKVKANFSLLLVKVQSSLEDRMIPAKKVRRFLMGIFEGGCNISKEGDMDDIFDAITKEQLWSYDNYGPLEELAVNFLPTDDGTILKVTKYESQLSAFQAITKIIDFINLYKLEDYSPKENNSHHQRLTVGLRQERVISEVTLEHINEFWKLLAKEFCRLPPLRAVIDSIVKGGLKITWLLLPHTIKRITASYFKSIDFLQQHDIISIDLYRDSGNCKLILYDEESMVTGATPMYQASFTGDIDEVKKLLEGGANVDKENTNADGYTPLIGASMTDQDDIARLLLRHRADVDYQTKRGLSALMAASMFNHPSTALVLLEHGAKVDLSDVNRLSALARAVDHGYADTTRLLLENGATMNFEDDVWKRALHNAVKEGFSEAVSVVLKYGAPVNIVLDHKGSSALCVACENGRAEMARVLLDHGAIIDHQNKRGRSAVHHASEGGHVETVKLLLERSAQLDLQDEDGWTALVLAAQIGNFEIVKLLLERGAAVDVETESGLTALKLAQSEGRQDICDILLQYSRQGPKVITPTDDEESTKANPALTEAITAEVRSVRERLWCQIKKILLNELVKKEEAAKARGESELVKKEEAARESEHFVVQNRKRRAFFSRVFRKRGRRTPRRGHKPVVGTAPAPDCDVTNSTQQDSHSPSAGTAPAPVPEQTGHDI